MSVFARTVPDPLGQRVLEETFERLPVHVPDITSLEAFGAVVWLRQVAVSTARAGLPPREAFEAACALAPSLHEGCEHLDAAGQCPHLAAAMGALSCDLRGALEDGDDLLGAAMLASPVHLVLAAGCLAAAAIVVIDGSGAAAQVSALTARRGS